MKTFYKIIEQKAEIGSGTIIPEGFIQYTIGEEPDKLLKALLHKTDEEIVVSIKEAIKKHLDHEALMLGYDDINSIGKYLGYENSYRAQCETLGVLVSAIWKYIEEQIHQVSQGKRTLPTIEEAIAEIKENIPFDYYVEQV